MIVRRLIATLAAAAAALTLTVAQIPANIKSVDVNSLPEKQVKEIAMKLKAQGATVESVAAMAEARGASKTQAADLQRRMKRYLPTQAEADRAARVGAKNAAGTKQSATSKTATAAGTLAAQPQETSDKSGFYPTEEDMMVFGFNIFNKDNLTFEPSENMAAGDSYVIGVGDVIDVDVYGAADMNYSLTVDKNGNIMVPMVGPIKVGGTKLGEATGIIKNRLRSIYHDMDSRTKASIRISSVRPIVINVMGEAFMPGTYTVSAAASMLHALYLCGGPTAQGSFRDIQLIRDGRIIKHFDVYGYLVNGQSDGDLSLKDGDIIMVPPYGKRVSVGGAFKRTGYFEAKEGETAADLIRYAGGFTPQALTSVLRMHRMGRYTTEFKTVSDPAAFLLANGDSLSVGKIDFSRVDNSVTVRGAVFAQGTFEFHKGMKLSQLIALAGGLKEDAFMNRGIITRLKDDYTLESINFRVGDIASGAADIELKDGDEVSIIANDETHQPKTIRIHGEVNAPGEYAYAENITLGDLIVLAGGLTEKASLENIEIMRQLPKEEADKDLTRNATVDKTTITADLTIGDSNNDYPLEPFDQIHVRTRGTAQQGGYILLIGALVSSGSFGLNSNSVRVSEVINRAGGLTNRADIDAARIYRRIVLTPVERQLKLQRSIELQIDTLPYLKPGNTDYELVAIDLRKALEHPGSAADIYLNNNDIFMIPEMSQTVRIGGQVQNAASVQWEEGWNAKKYVKAAGGFSANADKKRTFVVYPSGRSETVKHILWFRRYPKVTPGTEVMVPEKPERQNPLPTILGSTSTLVSIAVAVAVLLK